jgi:hypothetical protein
MKRLSIILTSLVIAISLSIPLSGHAQCDNNLITNGDFYLGNVGFLSDYTYISPQPNILRDPGTYTIDTSPAKVHNSWADYGDYSTGSGNMLIVNAACNDGGGSGCDSAVQVVWQQTVPVFPNTEYVFTYHLSSSYATNLAYIKTSINGTELGQQYAPGTTGIWQEVSYNWNSGTSTSATIILEDLTRQYSGDDFAIDDISLCLAGDVVPLCADQTMNVGYVQVWNDGTNLYVTYVITERGACLTETHLHVAGPNQLIPQTKKYNPIPGHFAYSEEHNCVISYPYTIPLTWASGDALQIAAHAVVQMSSSTADGACADGYADFTQGPMNNGNSVSTRIFPGDCDAACRVNPANAYGEPDGIIGPHDTFFSLGLDGYLTLTFPSFVGGELTVYETSWGGLALETAEVYVSRDGAYWTLLGEAVSDSDASNCASYPTSFLLNECVQYVKIVDTTDESLFANPFVLCDAFDVDAVCASNTCEEETAWGDGCEGTSFLGKNWATYFIYTVQ